MKLFKPAARGFEASKKMRNAFTLREMSARQLMALTTPFPKKNRTQNKKNENPPCIIYKPNSKLSIGGLSEEYHSPTCNTADEQYLHCKKTINIATRGSFLVQNVFYLCPSAREKLVVQAAACRISLGHSNSVWIVGTELCCASLASNLIINVQESSSDFFAVRAVAGINANVIDASSVASLTPSAQDIIDILLVLILRAAIELGLGKFAAESLLVTALTSLSPALRSVSSVLERIGSLSQVLVTDAVVDLASSEIVSHLLIELAFVSFGQTAKHVSTVLLPRPGVPAKSHRKHDKQKKPVLKTKETYEKQTDISINQKPTTNKDKNTNKKIKKKKEQKLKNWPSSTKDCKPSCPRTCETHTRVQHANKVT